MREPPPSRSDSPSLPTVNDPAILLGGGGCHVCNFLPKTVESTLKALFSKNYRKLYKYSLRIFVEYKKIKNCLLFNKILS
jgi:hypothetical protein